jgi:hypothetical protein
MTESFSKPGAVFTLFSFVPQTNKSDASQPRPFQAEEAEGHSQSMTDGTLLARGLIAVILRHPVILSIVPRFLPSPIMHAQTASTLLTRPVNPIRTCMLDDPIQ